MLIKKKELRKEIKIFTSNFGPQYSAANGELKLRYKQIVNSIEENIVTICSVLFTFYRYISYAQYITKQEAQIALMKLKLEYLENLIVDKQVQACSSNNQFFDYVSDPIVAKFLGALLIILLVVGLYKFGGSFYGGSSSDGPIAEDLGSVLEKAEKNIQPEELLELVRASNYLAVDTLSAILLLASKNMVVDKSSPTIKDAIIEIYQKLINADEVSEEALEELCWYLIYSQC